MTVKNVVVQRAVAVLPVGDVAVARDFYCDVLGFASAFEQGTYIGVQRDGVELHLDGYATEGVGAVSVRLDVEGIDELHDHLDARGAVDPAEPLETKPWGTRQFSVRDPWGNRVTFVSP